MTRRQSSPRCSRGAEVKAASRSPPHGSSSTPNCGASESSWLDDLAAVIGFDLSVATGAPAVGDVVLDLDAALTDTDGGERFDEEGYTLTATPGGIDTDGDGIAVCDPAGDVTVEPSGSSTPARRPPGPR